jgi:hypothetical protein
MFTLRRGARAPWHLTLVLLVAGCGGPGEKVRTCSTDAECGPGALCIQSACVANRPPVVTLQLPPSPTTNRVLFLDATATDPDAGDSISRLTWSVTPAGAPCEAEPEPSTGSRLEVVFWCAGAYEVAVVAEDGRGGTSAPAKQTIEVAQATGAPVVTSGPESLVDHACGGTPFACRPASSGSPVSLPLTAVVDDPAGGALAFRWRALPAPGADPRAVVTYAQGETSLSTEAWLETPGGAIAGTWRFRLRVTDAAGLVGRADQVVVIGNRPPALTGQPLQLDHRYEGGTYWAGGSLPVPATDPDGDPVSLTATLDEVGTDGCTSQLGTVTAGALTFETRCGVASRLIGLASRTIRVIAVDGNGGSSEAAFPVEIGNRPPALRLASNPAGGHVTLDHSVGACPIAAGSCFLAAGTATFTVVDPDGDPVTGPAVAANLPSNLRSSTGEATTAGGVATFRFATALSAPRDFRASDGSTYFSLVATSADPFGASSSLEIPVVINNRPPILKNASALVAVGHRYDPVSKAYLATAPLSSFEDPDGDPLYPSGSTGDPSCATFSLAGGEARVACAREYALASGLPPLAGFVGDHPVVLRVFDGWEGVSLAAVVNIQNGAPTATAFDGTVESCFCACSKWSADGSTCVGQATWVADATTVPLPVTAGDVDGDPVQVSFSPVPVSGAQKTVLPGDCGDTLSNTSLPVTVQVTIDDGVGRAQTTSRVTGVSCSTAGQACLP